MDRWETPQITRHCEGMQSVCIVGAVIDRPFGSDKERGKRAIDDRPQRVKKVVIASQ